MNIRILSPYPTLAESVARLLREPRPAGVANVEVAVEARTECALYYRRDLPLAEITGLVERLKPLLPAVQPRDELRGMDVELSLGDVRPFGQWEVKLTADTEALTERLRGNLGVLGFRDDGTFVDDVETNTLKYGGASSFARQVIRFLLHQEGIRVAESKDWGDDDDDVWLHVQDASVAGKSARERYPVEIHGDDYEQMFELERRLREAGFLHVQSKSLEQPATFAVDTGPMARDIEAASVLVSIVEAFCAEREVPADRFPVRSTSEARGHAKIELPTAALRAGTLIPYEGAFPERWEVVLRSDAPASAALVAELAALGFRARLEPLGAVTVGFSLRLGAARAHAEVVDVLRGVLENAMADLPLAAGYALGISETLDEDSPLVVVDFPAGVAARMPFSELLTQAARGFDLSLKTPSPEELQPLADALKRLPWKEFELESEGEARGEIQYGGAPLALVEHVRDLVKAHTGAELGLTKTWGDADDDIWVHVPRAASALLAEDDVPLDLDEWLGSDADEVPRTFLEVGADHVRIGHLTLPRRQGPSTLVPSPAQFEHYCVDTRTADTLLHLAEGVLLREPALLEGETSVSKTSIVLYLAMLLNQPVVRLNLNGQTDTGELVGRYVPQDAASSLPVGADELYAAKDLLELESRMILERAAQEGRSLSRVEVQQVMANERMTVHPWRWQDGLVVTAMKRGWWVVLDELNLAEPQILERLNPVLEVDPMLVLTEHDNSVIGAGGTPVHPDFRLFGTMNPAEYAGRSALSPAYRDRWRGYRFVVPPGEAEYLAMLRFLVHGDQPEVAVAGRAWLGTSREPPMGALAELPGIDDFLRALARFHAAIEEAVGRRGSARGSQLGVRRRERYVFSRRGLLSVVEYLAAMATALPREGMSVPSPSPAGGGVRAMRRALARYYLGRVTPGADQRVVARLLDAAGIGPGTWAPERLDALAAGSARVAAPQDADGDDVSDEVDLDDGDDPLLRDAAFDEE